SRPRGPDTQRLRELQRPPEGEEQDAGDPDALGDPRRNVQGVGEGEEGPHREEVAGRLVLDLTEAGLGVPQVEGAPEELGRGDVEIELGVGDDATRFLQEAVEDDDERDGKPADALDRRRPPTARLGDGLRDHPFGGEDAHATALARAISMASSAAARNWVMVASQVSSAARR